MRKINTAIMLNFISLAAVLVVNFLAVNLPLNNLTTKQISDSFDIYFVPAGYVFSIWGFIYLALITFSIYRALPKNRENEKFARVDAWLVAANACNVLWLVSFHYQQFLLALMFMFILLIVLINIFEKLEIGKCKPDLAWKWAVEVPFSVYLGWITVATIANVTQVLDFVGWNGFGISEEIWFLVVVAAVVIISAVMSITRRAFEYVLVLVWALVGIAVKFPDVPLVNYSAWGGAIAITVIDMLALITASSPSQKKN